MKSSSWLIAATQHRVQVDCSYAHDDLVVQASQM